MQLEENNLEAQILHFLAWIWLSCYKDIFVLLMCYKRVILEVKVVNRWTLK